MGRLAITKLLIANRGEIACRVMKTAKKLGIGTVAVFSDADRHAKHVTMADEAYHIGAAPATASYLRGDRILDVAMRSKAQAVHPGYGFLSENTDFAAACADAGIKFVGPPSSAILAMGDKTQAKHIMEQAGVPVVPGYHKAAQELDRLVAAADEVGYPLLVKAAMGGGGKGMKLAFHSDQVKDAILSAQREAASSFGDSRVLLERFIERPRHVEVQVFADSYGDCVWLYERDCSVQRRHQKVIEEAPAPGLDSRLRQQFGEAAVAAAKAVGYENAGTVEFIMDTDNNDFFFMEMNTRLQVEHPVTEAVTGVDLVEWQLRVASGEPLPLKQEQIKCTGHAFEGRLYAEVPHNDFLPGTGTVARWRVPEGASSFEFLGPPGSNCVRVDSGVQEGDQVGVYYDPMCAKVLVTGPDRPTALQHLRSALSEMTVAGLPTNQDFMRRIASHPAFQRGAVNTSFIEQHKQELLHTEPAPESVAVLAWLVDYHNTVQQLRSAYPPVPHMGPWYLGDSMRVNHTLQRKDVLKHSLSGTQYHIMASFEQDGSIRVTVQREGCKNPSTFTLQQCELVGTTIRAEVDNDIVCAEWTQHKQMGGREVVMDVWLGTYGGRTWHQFKKAVVIDWAAEGDRAPGAQKGGRVLAPMPGKVIKVEVTEGQEVKEGDRLLVLEAMKMEHPVKSPRNGRVQGLNIAVGGQVQDGDLLITIDPV